MARPLPLETRETARALILKGLPAATVATQLDVNVATIHKWSDRFGWVEQRSAVQHVVQTAVAKSVIDSQVIEQTRASNRVRKAMSKVIESQAQILVNQPANSVGELANSKEGQGHAAVAKTVAETASVVFGWGKEGDSTGMIALGDLDGLDAQTAPVIDVETVAPADGKVSA